MSATSPPARRRHAGTRSPQREQTRRTTGGSTAGTPYQPRTFDEAYSHLFAPLCRFVRSRADALHRMRLPEGAESVVVQRVFDAAFATGWDTIPQPRTWLYAVAGHHLRLMASDQHAGPDLTLQTATWTEAATTRASVTEVNRAAIVAGHVVCELPGHRSQAAYLRWCERWSITEIADALGISETATRAHSDRGLPQDPGQRDPGEAVALRVAARVHAKTPLFAVLAPRPRAHQSSPSAELFTTSATLLLSVLCAASGLVLGSTWPLVLGLISVVLALKSMRVGLRYLRNRHRRARLADMQRAGEHPARPPGALARGLMGAVHCYRAVLAPLLPISCRLDPSCSTYALQVLARYGATCGTVLAFRRLWRCRFAAPRGRQPVPDPAPQRTPVPYCLLRPARQRRRITL